MTEWSPELLKVAARELWFAYASDDGAAGPDGFQNDVRELLDNLREFIVPKAEMREESFQAVGHSMRWRRFVTDWEECSGDE